MTIVLRTIQETREWVQQCRSKGESIGLVPTMGFLHEGHISLMRQARASCTRTIASIFVNPLQFGPNEDFERYPRNFQRDLALLEEAGVDAVFAPEVAEMYPRPLKTKVEVSDLTTGLCGVSRPGHFTGVTTVVSKLFHIVTPDKAFFGQKDAQQAIVLQRMVADLNFPLELVICPIIREADGLAMSSRNVYLTPNQRAQAPVLYQSLCHATQVIKDGESSVPAVVAQIKRMISSAPLAQIDYVQVVDLDTLQEVEQITGPVLIALAVRFGTTRLIDNVMLLKSEGE